MKEQEVFLDSDNLTDLRQLLVHIADSDCIALLYTAVRYFFDVASHPPLQFCWCSTNTCPSIAGRDVAAVVPP